MNFPFNEDPNTATFTCIHIIEYGDPILHVFHDDDGTWQFLCDKHHKIDDAKLVSLKSIFDLDNSVGMLKDLAYGKSANRSSLLDSWTIE